MKNVLSAVAALAISGSAAAQAPRFTDIVGYELYQLVHAGNVGVSPDSREIYPTFYAEEFNRIEEVRCERTASFGLITMANLSGHLLAAVCDREADRVHALARDGKRGLATVLKQLGAGGVKIDHAKLAQAGWTYRLLQKPDGEEHHFPVLLVGHGIVGPQTMVFAPRGGGRVVVVQADLRRYCDGYGQESTPLCTNMQATLAQLGRRVLSRTPPP